jgi:hypothetical protein
MDKYILIYIFFVNKYILNIETPRPDTNKHVHVHKCLHCAVIEPAIFCVVGEYSHHYATLAVKIYTVTFDLRQKTSIRVYKIMDISK